MSKYGSGEWETDGKNWVRDAYRAEQYIAARELSQRWRRRGLWALAGLIAALLVHLAVRVWL